MNMFNPSEASTREEYISACPADCQDSIKKLDRLIQEVAPSLTPHFASNMLGYGSFPYKNYKGEMIEWPTVALSNRKNYISLYVCALDGDEYIAEKYRDSLGKVTVGKSCIRFKVFSDLNEPVLRTVLIEAAANPGLGGR